MASRQDQFFDFTRGLQGLLPEKALRASRPVDPLRTPQLSFPPPPRGSAIPPAKPLPHFLPHFLLCGLGVKKLALDAEASVFESRLQAVSESTCTLGKCLHSWVRSFICKMEFRNSYDQVGRMELDKTCQAPYLAPGTHRLSVADRGAEPSSPPPAPPLASPLRLFSLSLFPLLKP